MKRCVCRATRSLLRNFVVTVLLLAILIVLFFSLRRVAVQKTGHEFDALQAQELVEQHYVATLDDFYVQQEVDMHQVETAVLDAATQGRYTAYADAVVRRYQESRTAPQAVMQLTLADLQHVADLLEMDPSQHGWKSASFAALQFHLTVGFRFVNLRLASEAESHRAFYRWTKTLNVPVPSDKE